jgi:hypothetical protein
MPVTVRVTVTHDPCHGDEPELPPPGRRTQARRGGPLAGPGRLSGSRPARRLIPSRPGVAGPGCQGPAASRFGPGDRDSGGVPGNPAVLLA